jgi:hypothetical protein
MSDPYDGIQPEVIYQLENIYSTINQIAADIRKLQKEVDQLKNGQPLEQRKFK